MGSTSRAQECDVTSQHEAHLIISQRSEEPNWKRPPSFTSISSTLAAPQARIKNPLAKAFVTFARWFDGLTRRRQLSSRRRIIWTEDERTERRVIDSARNLRIHPSLAHPAPGRLPLSFTNSIALSTFHRVIYFIPPPRVCHSTYTSAYIKDRRNFQKIAG